MTHATIGTVYLTVEDLDRQLQFYTHNIGLKLHRRDGNTAYLGTGRTDLLALTQNATAPRAQRTAGLYHFAILVPSRLELAKTLANLIQTRTPIQGFSDHAVSEALYLSDAEGNGIEIYRDRPRSEWPMDGDRLTMTTLPLDLDNLLSELSSRDVEWDGLHADTIMGHIHLHVSHLEPAVDFYRDVLGMDLVMRYGAMAAFMSYDGYHHHIGLNTWAGVGAPQQQSGAPGLHHYLLYVDDARYADIQSRIDAAGTPTETQDNGLLVRDPSGNAILVTARSSQVSVEAGELATKQG